MNVQDSRAKAHPQKRIRHWQFRQEQKCLEFLCHFRCGQFAENDGRRSHVLVLCGDGVDEDVKNDIAIAKRLNITATMRFWNLLPSTIAVASLWALTKRPQSLCRMAVYQNGERPEGLLLGPLRSTYLVTYNTVKATVSRGFYCIMRVFYLR